MAYELFFILVQITAKHLVELFVQRRLDFLHRCAIGEAAEGLLQTGYNVGVHAASIMTGRFPDQIAHARGKADHVFVGLFFHGQRPGLSAEYLTESIPDENA